MSEAAVRPPVREVLRLVRRARPDRTWRDAAYRVYSGALAVALAVPPVVITVRNALQRPASPPEPPPQAAEVLPLVLTALVLIALWASLQDAVWRGPVRLGVAFVDWVLPLPLPRGALLRPYLLRAMASSAVLWGAACFLIPVLLWRTVLPMPDETGPILAQAAAAGVLSGLLGSGAGVLLGDERTVGRLRPFFYSLLFLLAGLAGLIWTGRAPTATADIVQWSGPWGWASRLLLSEEHRIPALALLSSAALAAGAAAFGRLPSLDPRGLRSGAQLSSGVRSGLWLTEGDWFRASLGEARRADFSPRVRLRPPADPRLLVPWRDLLGILRDGTALVRAFLLLGLSLLLARVEPETLPVSLRAALVIAGPLCMYLAVGGLMDGARYSAAVPDRARPLLHSPGGLALAHGAAPLLVALPLGLVWAAGFALAGAFEPLLSLVFLPAAAAAALAGIYRGVMPPQLMGGFDTPFGNSALIQMAVWHASGFLGLLAVVWPARSGGGAGGAVGVLAGTVLLGWWARRRGRRIMSGGGP